MAAKRAKFEVYRSNRDRAWRWRLRAKNGEIVAHGGEGFRKVGGVIAAIKAVKVCAATGSPQYVVQRKVKPAKGKPKKYAPVESKTPAKHNYSRHRKSALAAKKKAKRKGGKAA